MVKQIITDPPGFTFQEFSILTGETKRDCVITNINIETKLAEVSLGIPLLSAAMMSVTGEEMGIALAKERGLPVLPTRLPIEEQAGIVHKIKNYEMGFVAEPTTARETSTIDEVLRLVEQHGHSKVPIIDRNNTFLGIFSYEDYIKSSITRDAPVTRAMLTIEAGKVPYIEKPDLTVTEAKEILEQKGANYLVVLDNQKRLVKLAFKKDEEKLKAAFAISTHPGWQERVEACLAEGADLVFVDTSDGYNEFTSDAIKEYKQMAIYKRRRASICAGNIITYEGAMYLMEAGADIIKSGMSSGSICTTKREKAIGRAPLTALIEADRARRDFFARTGKYVALIGDGGITGTADLNVSLTIADGAMMGGYFNKFLEAAGEKYDENGKITTDEKRIKKVATWGEGSLRAQNLDRYGHASKHTFFAEGEEGEVDYGGRLKPALKRDLMKIRAALSNVGSYNLEQFRRDAVIERISPYAMAIINDTHGMKVKKA